MLTLRLEKEGQKENLHIYCGELLFISSSWAWSNACIEILHCTDKCEYSDEPYFLIQDAKANVKIHVGHMSVADNCKPILYRITNFLKFNGCDKKPACVKCLQYRSP